jgi:hypothetical protein
VERADLQSYKAASVSRLRDQVQQQINGPVCCLIWALHRMAA